MEDVLDTYQRSYDENEALVCMDETSRLRRRERRVQRRPTTTNTSAMELFMLFAPLEGDASAASDGGADGQQDKDPPPCEHG